MPVGVGVGIGLPLAILSVVFAVLYGLERKRRMDAKRAASMSSQAVAPMRSLDYVSESTGGQGTEQKQAPELKHKELHSQPLFEMGDRRDLAELGNAN